MATTVIEERWPWRLMVRGAFQDGWCQASDEERQRVFVEWIEAHKLWQEMGCRLIATVDDEANMTGTPGGRMWNFHTIWEIPDPRLVYDLLKIMRVTQPSGMRFDRYFRFEAIVSKPIIGLERGLGGTAKARTPGLDWSP